MKKFSFLWIALLTFTISFAQKQLTLDEIWTGKFKTEGMDELQALKNTNQYTVLNYDRAKNNFSIDLYDFATLTKVATLINSSDFKELESIDGYTFDATEKKMLIATNSTPIFRHSFTAVYYMYDLNTKKLSKLTDKAVQEPTFSADGQKIAYAYENNLYVYDNQTNTHSQITTDGKKNSLINGITDWVYEEEFAFVKAYDWNKTGDKIAYIKFDETEVPEFSMDLYNQGLYPAQHVFKYPKAGEKKCTRFVAYI